MDNLLVKAHNGATSADGVAFKLALRPSTRVLYTLVFGTMIAFAVAGTVAAAVDGSLGAIAGVLFAAVIGVWVYRQVRIAVLAEADQLIVRNMFRSFRFRREEIDHFRVGGSIISGTFVGGWPAVQVALKSGESVSFDVSIRPWFVRREDEQDAALKALQSWLRGA